MSRCVPHTGGKRGGEGQRPFVVAIDGPAASGKGTLARRLADRFGFAHLDTGALYRAAARLVLDEAGDPADTATAEAAARRVNARMLSDPRLRGDEVAGAASVVAAIPEVRILPRARRAHAAAQSSTGATSAPSYALRRT